MSAPPYMKLYVADYLGDTHHLSALEHGAYLLLLMAMWRAGGSLPAADANLSRIARCTADEWTAIKGAILPFFQRSRSRLTHKRVSEEMAKYDAISDRRSEASKRSRRQKVNDNKAPEAPFAEQMDPICSHNQNQNHISTEAKASGGEPPSANSKAWAEARAVLVSQGKMSLEGASAFFGKLLAQNGLEASELLGPIGEAEHLGTKDPQGFLTKAAQVRNRRRQPTGPQKRVSFV